MKKLIVVLISILTFTSYSSSKECNVKRIESYVNLYPKNKNIILKNQYGILDSLNFDSFDDIYVNNSKISLLKNLECQHKLIYEYKFKDDYVYLEFVNKGETKEFYIVTKTFLKKYTFSDFSEFNRIYKISDDKLNNPELIKEIYLENSKIVYIKTGDNKAWYTR